MSTQQIIISEIEKYIRDTVAKNNGSFNRDAILMQSKEWMEKYPVEFNSILNVIENERKSGGSDFMDDSMPSIHLGGGYADDSTPSVAYGGRYADDSTPSVAYGGRYADDSTPSLHHSGYGGYGGRYADDSTPSFHHGGGYADDSTPSFHHGGGYADEIPSIIHHQDDPMGSPIGSDVIDSSPNGNDDDDEIDSYMPLQRTMSSLPSQIRK